MHTVPTIDSPPVRAAVAALDTFGALDRATAGTLLALWSRRWQLTPAEADVVLAHYPAGGDPGGFDYTREPDNTAPAPVPTGVEGTPLGRRADR